MLIRETLWSALAALQANKFRTFLTALGLVIGNASVILVVTISLTSRDYILDQIQRIGSNMIYAQYEAGNNPSMAAADADYIKIADVDAIRDQLGSRILAATPVMNNFDKMRIEGREEDVAIIGTDHFYPKVRNLGLLAGRFLDAGDVRSRNHVALLTERLARRLFGGQQQAVSRTIKLHGLQFDVIGTFKEKTNTMGLSELSAENVLIPITVLKYFAPIERIDPLYVQALSPGQVEPITQMVRTILESLAAKLPTTGTTVLKGETYLFLGRGRVKVGDKFTVAFNGQDYELELTAIDRTTFTLRYHGEEITRSTKPGKSP